MKKNALVLILAVTMLMTACNSSSVPSDNTTISETTTAMTTETTAAPTPTPEPTPTPVVYDFTWTTQDSESFANYYAGITGRSQTLRGYIICYGFTDELNEMLTAYINHKYNTEYESVPFSKVSYFHSYVVMVESQFQKIRNNYSSFRAVCMYKFDSHIVFDNKLVMSYLYQNQIPLGARVPIDNFRALGLDDMFSFDGVTYMIDNDCFDLGSYDLSYEYSNYELFAVLQLHNIQIRELCNDERIKNLDILTDDPEFPQAAEAREIYNGFLKEYYGFDNCPQFGEVVTREQYKKIFGEEPLDLSYIPGAIFDPALVQKDSTVNTADSGSKTDERLIGEWTSPENYSGYTGTYIFNEDNTGTYTYTAQTMDLETGELSEKTTVTEFKYSIEYGMLVLEYDNGNTYSFNYNIAYGGLMINGGYFEPA